MRVRLREHVAVGANVRVYLHDLRRPGVRQEDLIARRWGPETSLRDEGHNLVTATGLDLLWDWARGTSLVGHLTHIGFGTDNTAAAAGDAALVAEVFRDIFTQISVGTFRYYLGPNDANGHTLREAGLFNAGAGGTLYARRVLTTPIVKTIDNASTIEWDLSFAAV